MNNQIIKNMTLIERLRDPEMYVDACDEAARELERLINENKFLRERLEREVKEPLLDIYRKTFWLIEKKRKFVLANPSDPSWTEYFAELQNEVRELMCSYAQIIGASLHEINNM